MFKGCTRVNLVNFVRWTSSSTVTSVREIRLPLQIIELGKACISLDLPLDAVPSPITAHVSTIGSLLSSQYDQYIDANKSKAELKDAASRRLFREEFDEIDHLRFLNRLPAIRDTLNVLPFNLLFTTSLGTGQIDIKAFASNTHYHIHIPVRIVQHGTFITPILLQ